MILEHLELATVQHGSSRVFAKNQFELSPYIYFLFYSYLKS